MDKDNYRNRCYDSFVSKHWKYTHELSKREYVFLKKVYRKRYGPFLPADLNAKILDIACGAGHFLYFIQSEGYKNSYGIDISKEQINLAKKMGVKNVEESDFMEYLPCYKKSFDVITANDIMEHLKKDELMNFLDLLYRCLKKEGILIVTVPNAMSLFGASAVFADFTHEIGFTPGSLAQVLHACNFTNVRVYGEKPVAHDFMSAVRKVIWSIFKFGLKICILAERGTGRGFRKYKYIFEPRMYAVVEKKDMEVQGNE